MNKLLAWKSRLIGMIPVLLSAVLIISANTNSCMAIYQPKAPAGLSRFSKIK